MERCRILSQTEKLHFIGIGGIGMSALAQYALRCGIKVSGSDTAENEQVKKLAALGAKISIGHARKNAKARTPWCIPPPFPRIIPNTCLRATIRNC